MSVINYKAHYQPELVSGSQDKRLIFIVWGAETRLA